MDRFLTGWMDSLHMPGLAIAFINKELDQTMFSEQIPLADSDDRENVGDAWVLAYQSSILLTVTDICPLVITVIFKVISSCTKSRRMAFFLTNGDKAGEFFDHLEPFFNQGN